MPTAFDSWLTETPEDFDDRMQAREANRANRVPHDFEPITGGTAQQRFESNPLNYLNFEGAQS